MASFLSNPLKNLVVQRDLLNYKGMAEVGRDICGRPDRWAPPSHPPSLSRRLVGNGFASID
jgi:hypothetical protein